MRTRRAKADTPATDAEPKPRPARKRTPAEPAVKAKTGATKAEPKPRTTRKRASKPTNS
ncbi:hypothetical protein ACWGQ5_52500 [Streptomyces sp. NPDC055722]